MNFLNRGEAEKVHLAALKILERTGILVYHDEAVSLLDGAGCEIDGKNLVRIPPQVVEETIRSVPPKVVLYNRNGEPAMNLGGRRSYWGTGSDTPFILDTFTGQRRQTCLEDIEKVSIIVDYLSNLDFLMCMGVAHELPQSIADKHHFLAMVSNTIKPIVFTASSTENLADIHEMACAVAGGKEQFDRKPFIIHYTEPIAPLIHPKDSLEKMLYCVEYGIPVVYTSATTAGQNGPATLAGSLALSVARILSGLVIGQLKRKGAEMIITMHISSMDPASAIHTYSSPEHVIGQAAAKSMAEFYNIPTFGRAGTSDSKTLDQQAAFEAGYEIFMHALCGENLIHDVGYLESGLTASWDLIVMCNEFIGAVKRVADGFTISDESFALDLIDKVGPDGHFMAEAHTVENFRKEFWFPELLDRSNYQDWCDKGATTLSDRLKERIKYILDNHKPEQLEPGLARELKALAKKKNKT